ncbi:MAG TPA: tetratricopeptide repeat protein [Caulobacteraceae bacterium]
MRAHRSLIAILPLALLGACATAKPAQETAAYVRETGPLEGSSYGLFLAGQAALQDGRADQASEYFMRATEGGAMDGGFLKEKAFMAALLGGEVTKAASLAPVVPDDNEAAYRMGLLVRAVEGMAQGRAKEARALLAPEAVGFPHRPAAALLRPWIAAAAGDTEGSLVRPVVNGDKVVEYFGLLGQAQLFERARRYDEAETDYKALAAMPEFGSLFVLDYGAFLERRNRRADAVELYNVALAHDPGDAELTAARARAQASGTAPALPSIREGAAKALTPAAAAVLGERQIDLARAYLRLSLRLDPERYEAWVLLGDLSAQMGDMQGAREAYLRVPPSSPEYSQARSRLAWSYQSEDDSAQALKMAAEAVAANPDDRDLAMNYADLLRANDRYAEANEVLSKLIAAEGESPDWRLLYMRGVTLERLGRWPDAEADLKQALSQQPDEPELLNYLGYTWIDRGERLQEALDMVRRASEANPNSGAMVDSLGWAYYRLGDYKQAVEKLERAVELDPADPEINHHLGDAYWRVGRRTEAQYQWRRVLTLKPNDETRAAVEGKLKSGLGPAPAKPAARIASAAG